MRPLRAFAMDATQRLAVALRRTAMGAFDVKKRRVESMTRLPTKDVWQLLVGNSL
jgi:hypothetical protein